MTHKEMTSKNPFPKGVMAIALALSMALFASIGWQSWNTYQDTEMNYETILRIQELRGTILHLDEVLTMSARMAAATAENQWERRYRRFEPELDSTIKAAMALSPKSFIGQAAALSDEANIKLVQMENRAFDMVRSGNRNGAATLLASEEYENLKGIYAEGMKQVGYGSCRSRIR